MQMSADIRRISRVRLPCVSHFHLFGRVPFVSSCEVTANKINPVAKISKIEQIRRVEWNGSKSTHTQTRARVKLC